MSRQEILRERLERALNQSSQGQMAIIQDPSQQSLHQLSGTNSSQRHQRNFTQIDSNLDNFTSQRGASGGSISSGSENRSNHGRHRRGTNSISFAGQIVTGVTNRQIIIPSTVQSGNMKSSVDLEQQAPERMKEESEEFFFGSPERRQKQRRAQIKEQQLMNLHQSSHPFNGEAPNIQVMKQEPIDDMFQIELLTQESTPDKDYLDRSNSNHQLNSSIYDSSNKLDPAFSRANHQTFDQIASFEPQHQGYHNHFNQQLQNYQEREEMDQIDRIFSETYMNNEEPFFNSDEFENMAGTNQEPQSIMSEQASKYEMVSNKGLSKREKKTKKTHNANQSNVKKESENTFQSESDYMDQQFQIKQETLIQITDQRSQMSQVQQLSLSSASYAKQKRAKSIKEFKQSDNFQCLQDLQSKFDDLDFKEQEENDQDQNSQDNQLKFDFESEKGSNLCTQILKQIQTLFNLHHLEKNDRSYRIKFTKAYKNLYELNGGHDELCYLQEILDSAQENFPHLWVNGEKYVFSDDVLSAGETLYRRFLELRDLINQILDMVNNLSREDQNVEQIDWHESNLKDLNQKMKQSLRDFDIAWVTYEQFYVYELMVIETDSRRFIIDAIVIDEELRDIEACLEKTGSDPRSDEQYNEKRQMLVHKLALLNTVCNVNGKGRDDLVDLRILQAAEQLPQELLTGEAQSIQILADKIRQSFNCYRMLLQKYANNIDSLDPQLRNNVELIEVVDIYENAWSQGMENLVDQARKQQIIHFCRNIDTLCKKYQVFQEQIECSEAEIFLSIPSLMILKSIQNDDGSAEHKQLCQRFSESIEFSLLQAEFYQLQGDARKICSQLEQFIINDDSKSITGLSDGTTDNGRSKAQLLSFGQKLKKSGMELSRHNAQEFNDFIKAALGE